MTHAQWSVRSARAIAETLLGLYNFKLHPQQRQSARRRHGMADGSPLTGVVPVLVLPALIAGFIGRRTLRAAANITARLAALAAALDFVSSSP